MYSDDPQATSGTLPLAYLLTILSQVGPSVLVFANHFTRVEKTQVDQDNRHSIDAIFQPQANRLASW